METGLFWFWRFMNLSVTYLDTYLLTAPDPHVAYGRHGQYAKQEPNKTQKAQWRRYHLRFNGHFPGELLCHFLLGYLPLFVPVENFWGQATQACYRPEVQSTETNQLPSSVLLSSTNGLPQEWLHTLCTMKKIGLNKQITTKRKEKLENQ